MGLLLALTLVATATLLGASAVGVRRVTSEVTDLRRIERRRRAAAGEARRVLAAKTTLADAASGTTTAVQVGSMLTKAGHKAIADVPFSLFDALPPTQQASRVIRRIHDGVTDGVYDTIAGVSGGLGALSRRRLLSPGGTTPALRDGSDPPGPPTPPANLPD